MSTNSSQTLDLNQGGAVLPLREGRSQGASPLAAAQTRAERAESRQRAGKKMILAGFVVTILGVVLYCAACFAGGMDADMGDLLFRNAVPFARATLGVLGLGTLVWLVGSFTYLRGAMDADEESGETRG